MTKNAVRRCAVVAVAGIAGTGLGLGPGAPVARAAEIELEASMHASAVYPNAHGHAEYESEASREFDLSLSGLKALAGQRVIVRVHGDVVGKPRVSAAGRVHLDRHSSVPSMSAGNVVRVATASGQPVSSGTLRPDHDD